MITIPKNFKPLQECVMSNFDHSIDREIEKRLKNENVYAYYPGWNFCGDVWYDEENKMWNCLVWQFHIHIETIEAETLERIMEVCCERYGGQ